LVQVDKRLDPTSGDAIALVADAAQTENEPENLDISSWYPVDYGASTCVPADYGTDFDECNIYVGTGSNAKDVKSTNGHKAKPFKTLAYAVKQAVTGTTIYMRGGTYKNKKHGQGSQNDKLVYLNGVENLKIMSYPGETAKLKFDADGGIVGKNIKNVVFEGLEIEGPGADISYEEALADRKLKSAKFTGRGIAIWKGDHIQFSKMLVHHTTGSGMRVNQGDYVMLEDSEVYSTCWWSSAAESAVVYAESRSVDEEDIPKMIMRRNKVYDNLNKMPYYNSKYKWNSSPISTNVDCTIAECNPDETDFNLRVCPWQCHYGKEYQDYICDGMGVYVTRNNVDSKNNYTHGRTILDANEAYANGINGLVFHRTDRGEVTNNVVYGNGVVLRTYADSTEDWEMDLGADSGKKGRQPAAGITINNAMWDLLLKNNTVQVPNADDQAYTMEYDDKEYAAMNATIGSTDNVVCGEGKHFTDKLGRSDLFVTGSCSDNGNDYMTKKGKSCEGWGGVAKKCSSDDWKTNHYCQRRCFLEGMGYSDLDNRCCLPYL
jgi:hypothetical protein